MLKQLSTPIRPPADLRHHIPAAQRHLDLDQVFLAGRALFSVLEPIGRDDLVVSGTLDTERLQSVAAHLDEAAPGFLPPHAGGYDELARELSRLAAFTTRASKSAVQPRWHLGELVRGLDGWQLSHGPVGPHAGRFWRGFELNMTDEDLHRADYMKLRRALAAEGCADPHDRIVIMPLRLKVWSNELVNAVGAFLARLATVVDNSAELRK